MRNKFNYTPERVHNNLFYGAGLVAVLAFLATRPGNWWSEFTADSLFFEFFVIKGFIYYFLLFWLTAIPYLLLDKYKFKPLYKYKIQTNSKDTYSKLSKKLPKTIATVLENQFLGTLPAIMLVQWYLGSTGYDWTSEIPSIWLIALQLGLLLVCEEVAFFTVHYVMHTKFFYRKFHRIHHEYAESIGIATHYVHPVEHIFGNLLPVFLGLILFQVHMVTFLIWVTIAVINAVHSHSGYNIPGMSYNLYHDHHHYNFKGNYGLGLFMDKIFKTEEVFNDIKEQDNE